jgi:FKBP-type peptidyl-prolyl cis-trans isomerase FklB
MKRAQFAVTILMISFGLCAAGEAPEIRDGSDRISYSIGYQIGGDFKRQGTDLKTDLVVQGIQDALKGDKPRMPPEEMHKTLVEMKRKVMAAQEAEHKMASKKNQAEGEVFLAENAKKEGVVTLPSGLQYKILKEGEGASPKATDNVLVHYRGTLLDGTEFDSSHRRNRPATFRVNALIRGWAEALQRMKPGAKWQLFIPAKLAYADRGTTSGVPPNSVLLFEVELLKVN